jgi:hypothetical protein
MSAICISEGCGWDFSLGLQLVSAGATSETAQKAQVRGPAFVVWWIVPATHSMCGPAIEERVAAEPGLWAAHRLEDGVAVVRPGAQGIELVPFKNRTIDKKSPQTAGIVNHSTRGGK